MSFSFLFARVLPMRKLLVVSGLMLIASPVAYGQYAQFGQFVLLAELQPRALNVGTMGRFSPTFKFTIEKLAPPDEMIVVFFQNTFKISMVVRNVDLAGFKAGGSGPMLGLFAVMGTQQLPDGTQAKILERIFEWDTPEGFIARFGQPDDDA